MQVTEMRVICEEKKVNVAKAKVDCEELLVKIVQDKRIADDQEKQVNITQGQMSSCTSTGQCRDGEDQSGSSRSQ